MELSSSFGICVINIPTACTKVSTVPINHCVRNMNLDITKTVSQVVLKKIMKISFGGGGGSSAGTSSWCFWQQVRAAKRLSYRSHVDFCHSLLYPH